jgi:cadmium resistance transport/sequestration family protein
MEYSLALPGMALALFASTNIDDVFVLVGFFSDPKFRIRDIVIGQYAGIAALFGVSVAASLLSFVIPRAFIGLLGIAPIVIGAKKLFDHYRRRDKREETLESHSKSGVSLRSATVTIVTIANGADNIGIYIPSFAIRSGREIAVIGLVFAVMTALWCFIAHAMVNHPRLGAPIRRYGKQVAPIVLIGLGILILYQAKSVGLLLHYPRQ